LRARATFFFFFFFFLLDPSSKVGAPMPPPPLTELCLVSLARGGLAHIATLDGLPGHLARRLLLHLVRCGRLDLRAVGLLRTAADDEVDVFIGGLDVLAAVPGAGAGRGAGCRP
jgi:hypothetical protein